MRDGARNEGPLSISSPNKEAHRGGTKPSTPQSEHLKTEDLLTLREADYVIYRIAIFNVNH